MALNKAIIYAKVKPSNEQLISFKEFVFNKYNENLDIEFVYDENIKSGFKLVVGSDIYDWTAKGRYRQFKEKIEKDTLHKSNLVSILKESIDEFNLSVRKDEIGVVRSALDGIITIDGLNKATYGEVLVFQSGCKGMVQTISRDSIMAVLFGQEDEVSQGDLVYRTYKTAGMPVGDEFLGRVVDALGNPIDGLGPINYEDYLPLENPAPQIIDRDPVSRPLETGILTIDSMFPIGRGQRELIIGDRQTGKTAIALDTIINQKGKDCICVYVSIGQKASSIALLVETLKKKGAMDYTVVVSSFASDQASLQYVAPYAGCSIAEYFMHQGKDVLIIYDDLSKHAIAYRTISLLLGRAPGREAYPGDVFYLHSRLLERAAQLSIANGGGSMTALPIVETQASDVSAYIPTNIISITDGQIFLESELFFAGQRPAINIGLSVSRVGGAAQTKAVKAASGTLRLDLSQYREMEVFTQFASDLDETTKKQLHYGSCLMQVLKQPQYSPLSQAEEVITLVAALNRVFNQLPVNKVKDCQTKMLAYFNKNEQALCLELETKRVLNNDIKIKIVDTAHNFVKDYINSTNE